MLVSMKEILADAKKNHYAVPAFDVSNYEMMKAVLDVCRELKSPALLMGLEVDFAGGGMGLLAEMVKGAAKYYNIPICFHLDHASDLELIKKACKAGFSSVMYDGSKLPFEENAQNTAEVVKYARKMGITVEAELGHVGNAMEGNERDKSVNENPEATLMVASDVKRFIEVTDVDALAVAIGTAHGVYKKMPKLRIDRIDEITAVCNKPLVLHGGSGTPDEQVKQAIEHGITKINIYSDVVSAMNNGLKEKLNGLTNAATWPVYVFENARTQMKKAVANKIITFGSDNRI